MIFCGRSLSSRRSSRIDRDGILYRLSQNCALIPETVKNQVFTIVEYLEARLVGHEKKKKNISPAPL